MPSGGPAGETGTGAKNPVAPVDRPVTPAVSCEEETDSTAKILCQAYKLTLNRAPETATKTNYVYQLKNESNSLSEVLTTLILSSEFGSRSSIQSRTRDEFISDLYRVLLGRAPSSNELTQWRATTYSNGDLARMILALEEFGTTNPNLRLPQSTCRYGVNEPGKDAGPALAACMSLTSSLVRLLPGTYTLKTNLILPKTPGLTITTRGFETVTNQNPCLLNDSDSRCAILKSHGDNLNGPMLDGKDATGLTLRYIAFDGNIKERRAGTKSNYWNQNFGITNLRNNQANVQILGCERCSFIGIGSVRAVAASGFIFIGPEAVFSRSIFRNNGYDLNRNPNFGEWADGLTIVSGPRVQIYNSTFLNNTDINLIVGNAQGGHIYLNSIGATSDENKQFAFAGLMLDGFNVPGNNNFNGALIENNTIDCGLYANCGIGIDIGPYFWYTVDGSGNPSPPAEGGTVSGNTIRRARQGIGIYGANNFTVRNNTIELAGNYRLTGSVTSLTSLVDIALAPGQSNTFDFGAYTPTYNRLIPVLDLANNPSSTNLLTVFYSRTETFNHSLTAVASKVAEWFRTATGREPSSSELGLRNGRWLNGESNFDQVRSEIFGMAEAQALLASTGTAALYQRYLGRTPVAPEIAYWSGTSLSSQEAQISAAPEAIQYKFRTEIRYYYSACLGREADSAELSYWLSSGKTSAEASLTICESSAATALLCQRSDANRFQSDCK